VNRASVCVIGLGYIGLPTAATIAAAGHRVVGVDVNPQVVATINAGGVHFDEPGLERLVHQVVATGSLRAQSTPESADIFVICVPTPLRNDSSGRVPDTHHVTDAVRAIAPVLASSNLVIIESTCPVGTTEAMERELRALGSPAGEILLASCPERVLPGRILEELRTNDRIIGGINEASSDAAVSFYRTFVSGAVIATDSRTAEMVKLVENSFRDVNIAFANEVSLLSNHTGVDAWEVIRLANLHPRVSILDPGPGVGGHCIAIDPWFLVAEDPDTACLIRTAREVNDAKTMWVIDQIRAEVEELSRTLGHPARVACLGLTYKPDVDDLRESPALKVALALADAGIPILACDPHLRSHSSLTLHDVNAAIGEADLVALLVAHREFRELNLDGKRALDFCGLRRATAAGR
jgi:UDP-N-acetyl-D-mannosaminuronic acid dehydrogenase